MNRQRIIILLGVSIIGCLVIDSGIHSLNESNNKLLINYKNVELGIQNSQEISQINVANKWNQDIFNMQLSDDGNLIINPFYPLAVTNPAYKGNNAIIVNVTNSENELLYTYSGSGAIVFKVYDALNGKSVKDGDVVTIISNDQSIISDSNSNNETNQSNSDTESFIIKNNEFVKLYRPSITVDDGNLSVESKEYPDAKIIYKINGKSYEGTLVNGKFNAILPNGLPVNQEIEVELITPDIHTIEYAVYTQFSNQELNQTYNMSRRGSINPKGLWGRRGNDLALTAFQPIPITFDDKGGSISIEIKGPINGTANVDINNGTGLNKIITQIPVNQVVNVKIPGEGAIFLDTSNIQSMGNNEWEPFNFTTTVKVDSGFYRKIPVFDNREGEKLFDGVYTDNSKFVSDITSSDNINYPAIILGKYLVMYINNVAEINLDTNIDFNKVINLYNQTFVEDNKINGLSMNAENPINKFQVNNFFVSTDTDVPAGTIYTGDGTATYTLPSLFSYLLEPGWVVFHELGHIFNPRWAGNFLNGEVFSNMYTMISQEKIEGSSTWLFSGDQKYFEDTTILPIFTKYYEGSTSDNYLTNNYHTGLYYFYLLQEYYPDYVQKLSQLYSSEVVNGTLPYNNGDFLPYAMAKLYHVNIIPSLARWGNVVTNQNLIDFVIQNSTSSINLVPKNNDIFTSYSDITVVPTLNSIEVNGNTGIIQGIDNANTTVYVKYANNLYSGQTDSKGKFSINIPLQKSENKAVIYATGEGLKESLSKTIDIDTSKVTETINKDILKNEIEIASKINTDEYTDSSVQVLKNALNQAQNIVDDQNATQQEVSESTNILKEAIESLVKDVYWDGDALVINGELNGANMSSNVVKTLEITNEYGESVTLTGANVNWYSGNADNYNGYQFVIRQSLLRNLVGENYTLKVNVTVGNKQYSMPITAAGYILPNKMESGFNPMITGKDLTLQNVKTNSSKVELSTEVNMAKVLLQNPSYTTSQKDMLSKVLGEVEPVLSKPNATTQEIGQAVSKLESAMSSLVKMDIPNNAEIVYWDESSDQNLLVINGALTGLNIPSNVQKELVITNGTKTSTVMGANVNWYSGSADNYNGYQFILGSKQLKGLNEGIYSMYVKFTLNGKAYEVPISIDKALPLVVKNDFMPINSEGSLQLVTGSVRIKLLEDIQSLKASDIGNESSVLNVINQAEVIAKLSTATQAQLKNEDSKLQEINK